MKKNNIIQFLCITLVLSAGCMAMAGEKSSETEGKKLTVMHEVKYTNKGTRSEGQSGYLIINGILMPDCFDTVVADGKVYNFYSKKTIWGRDGYFPVEDIKADDVYPAVNAVISEDDIKRGWCLVNEKCRNTPEGWIFVNWGKGSAAVMPERINELINAESLAKKQRRIFIK